MKTIIAGTSAVALLLTIGISQGTDSPPLSAEYMKKRDLIVPSSTEKSYRAINWRTSVLHGLADAQKNDKPIMLVLMNGHPLGCT
jgi:hypothetical protein